MTALCLLPGPCRRILYTTYYESIASSGPFFGYYFFNSLLLLLQLLHVFWSFLILRMIRSFVKKGQVGPGEGGSRAPPWGPSPRLMPTLFPRWRRTFAVTWRSWTRVKGRRPRSIRR